MEKEEDEIKNLNNFPNRLMNTVGALASVTIITSILYLMKLMPLNSVIAMGLFISLPIAFTFIFGIIFNKPNFSTIRHYGFLVYLIIAFLIYLIVFTKPTSLLEGIIYSWHFLLGLIISVIAFFTYTMSSKILKKQKYRIRTSVSLGISLAITFAFTFILKHYKVFELINKL